MNDWLSIGKPGRRPAGVSRSRRSRQRGAIGGIPEVAMALAVAALVLAGISVQANRNAERIRDQVAAEQMAAVDRAAEAYLVANWDDPRFDYSAMSRATAVTEVIDLGPGGEADELAPFLVDGAVAGDGLRSNPFRQDYELRVRTWTDGTTNEQRMEALLVTKGGAAIPPTRAPRIAGMTGAGGGYVPSDADPAYTGQDALGASGLWQMQLSDFGLNGADPAVQGRLASAMVFSDQALGSDYLVRHYPGDLAFNTMSHPLKMEGNEVHGTRALTVDTGATVPFGPRVSAAPDGTVILGPGSDLALIQAMANQAGVGSGIVAAGSTVIAGELTGSDRAQAGDLAGSVIGAGGLFAGADANDPVGFAAGGDLTAASLDLTGDAVIEGRLDAQGNIVSEAGDIVARTGALLTGPGFGFQNSGALRSRGLTVDNDMVIGGDQLTVGGNGGFGRRLEAEGGFLPPQQMTVAGTPQAVDVGGACDAGDVGVMARTADGQTVICLDDGGPARWSRLRPGFRSFFHTVTNSTVDAAHGSEPLWAYAECGADWTRIACSGGRHTSAHDVCAESACGYVGSIPWGERGCYTGIDHAQGSQPTATAYCLKLVSDRYDDATQASANLIDADPSPEPSRDFTERDCYGGQYWDEGRTDCVCLAAYEWYVDRCVPCRNGKVWDSVLWECSCPDGQHWEHATDRCVPNQRFSNCDPKGANSIWNTVDAILQNWDGDKYGNGTWVPPTTTTYNTTGSTTRCRYQCAYSYIWTGSQCIQCPSGTHWVDSVGGCVNDQRIPLIGVIAPDGTAPGVDIAFIVDNSGSMGSSKMNRAKDAVLRMKQVLYQLGLHPMIDTRVIAFNSNASSVYTGLISSSEFDKAVNSIHSGGGTNYGGALDQTVAYFNSRPSNHTRLGYFISDGRPNSRNYDSQAAQLKGPMNVHMRAFGVENRLSQLNVIDSTGAAVYVPNASSLSTSIVAPIVSIYDVLYADVYVDGTYYRRLSRGNGGLTESPIGIRYSTEVVNTTGPTIQRIDLHVAWDRDQNGSVDNTQVTEIWRLGMP